MKIKTSELSDAALAYAFCIANGWQVHQDALKNGHVHKGFWVSGRFPDTNAWTSLNFIRPQEDWSQGGPIIERERIDLQAKINAGSDYDEWLAVIGIGAKQKGRYGPTPLVAAMRIFMEQRGIQSHDEAVAKLRQLRRTLT